MFDLAFLITSGKLPIETHIIRLFVKGLLCHLHILNDTTLMEHWGGAGPDAKGSTLVCLFSWKITILLTEFLQKIKVCKSFCVGKSLVVTYLGKRWPWSPCEQHLSPARTDLQEPCSSLESYGLLNALHGSLRTGGYVNLNPV